MGMNGARGRAKLLAATNRRLEREARRDGVDPADRKAFTAWKEAQSALLYARIMQPEQPS